MEYRLQSRQHLQLTVSALMLYFLIIEGYREAKSSSATFSNTPCSGSNTSPPLSARKSSYPLLKSSATLLPRYQDILFESVIELKATKALSYACTHCGVQRDPTNS